MPWIQLSLNLPRAQTVFAEQLLLAAGSLSVTFKDAEDNPVLEPAPGETPLWDNIILTGLFEAGINTSLLREHVEKIFPQNNLRIEPLEDRDWVRAWMDDYKPMQFGKRLWVCPKHLAPPQPDAVNLMLDPGLAFGTGTHATTALCLQWLDSFDVCDKTLLDFGCGSGVLAIAALMLGAAHADGCDIDPQALVASRNNALDNHVAEKLDVMLPGDLPEKKYDVVMANILAGPLVQLAPELAGFTRSGGHVVLSGILQTQADEICRAYKSWFELDAPVVQDDWVRISGVKRAS
ncbi:MAG: Ribosomal protein methyltransferase [Pseudomonadota bacterium]|nr:Ribosomal protein methyltransferase [Pseudomonadota bacterium]